MVRRYHKAAMAGVLCLLAPLCPQYLRGGWVAAGPFGGNAEIIAASATDPSFLISGTKNALLYTSHNAGASWQPLQFPRQYAAMLHTVVMHPVDASTFYVAVADADRPGLYRTIDAGKTWKPVQAFLKDEVYSLAFWGADPKIMAAGTRRDVRLSRDGGETWTTISPVDDLELQPVVSVAFDPRTPDTIYAGTPRLPWKTVDSGAHWNLIAEGMVTDSDILTVRVDPSRPSRVFIGACSGFWRTTTGGELWAKMTGIPSSSRRTYAFAQDPANPELIFAGTSRGLYRTRNGGADWKGLAGYEIKSLAISEGTLYVATADQGLFKSTDQGATLTAINDGFASRNVTRVAERDEHLYTSTSYEADAGGVFSSSDGGLHWLRLADSSRLGDQNVVSVARSVKGYLFAATPTGLFRSADAGVTWTRSKVTFGGRPLIAVCALAKAMLAATETGIFRSADEGLTWTAVDGSGQGISSLLYSGAAVAVMPHQLLVSGDDGLTWNSRSLPFFADIYDVAVAGDRLLAGTSRGLFRSEDGAFTWHAAESGLPKASISAVAIDPVTRELAYAYEYGNLYESRNAGKTWQRFDQEGLGGAFVRSFAISSQSPRHLLALTATRGIFVREIENGTRLQSSFSAVQLRKDRYVPNQQNDKPPAI